MKSGSLKKVIAIVAGLMGTTTAAYASSSCTGVDVRQTANGCHDAAAPYQQRQIQPPAGYSTRYYHTNPVEIRQYKQPQQAPRKQEDQSLTCKFNFPVTLVELPYTRQSDTMHLNRLTYKTPQGVIELQSALGFFGQQTGKCNSDTAETLRQSFEAGESFILKDTGLLRKAPTQVFTKGSAAEACRKMREELYEDPRNRKILAARSMSYCFN